MQKFVLKVSKRPTLISEQQAVSDTPYISVCSFQYLEGAADRFFEGLQALATCRSDKKQFRDEDEHETLIKW